MASIISCRSVSKAYGSQTLFSDLNLIINEGDRIGLIGPNGSGKSTLLKILADLEDEDSGTILRKNNMIAGYLAQQDHFVEAQTPLENLVAALSSTPLEEAEKLNRAQAMLSRVELESEDVTVAQLSGGWRKRLSICRALIAEPDLVIMDEPTNHLDIEGILWLEQLLSSSSSFCPATFVLVSHDRRFLENCVNRVVELSSVYPTATFQVNGRYSMFLEKKALFLAEQHKLEEKLANRYRRETEWLRRGPKARTTKARYRIDEAHRLGDQLDQVKQQNRADNRVGIDFSGTNRKTKKLLEISELAGQHGEASLFSGLSFTITPGLRLGLVGRNGCGKSTLLHMLYDAARGAKQPEHGTIRAADNLSVVHFSQDRRALDPQQSLRRTLAPEGDSIVFRNRQVHVVSWAKRFLFRVDQLETPVGTLSGGEQARIGIAELMRQPADVLLLDEPTNDLDIASLDVLEEGLLDFPGAIILVTHDRYLLDKVCERILGFIDGGTVRLYGDYEQWLAELITVEGGAKKGLSRTAKAKVHKAPLQRGPRDARLSYLDQREYDLIEEKIEVAEQDCQKLEELIEDPDLATDQQRLAALWSELELARSEVERLYSRWDELERKKAT
jgi:ATP-binding cassette subfamily F protein uup